MSKDFLAKKSSLVVMFIFMLIVISGAVAIRYTWNHVVRQSSEEAIKAAKIAASALNGESLKHLSGTPEDANTEDYQKIKRKLINIKATLTDVRFAYLFTKRENKIYFMADSEPEDSKDYSPPGQEYPEADTNYIKLFESKEELITPPITDRWGTWVSVLVPIRDEITGERIAAFGLDYDADSWKSSIILHVLRGSVLIVIAFLLFLTLSIRLVLQNKVLKNEAIERKLSDEALRESEEKFRVLFETAKDGIFQLTSTGSIVALNESFARMHGYTKEELMNKNLKDLDTPESARLNQERIERLLAGESITFEVEHYCKNGKTIPLEVSANVVIIGGEKYFLGFHRDITMRKRAEEELLKSKSILQEAQRVGRLGSWEWDAKTDTISWSEEYYHIYGFDPKQSPPKYEEHLKMYTPESIALLDAAVKKSMQTGEEYQLDLELAPTNDGTTRWVTAHGEVKYDDKGQIVGLRGTAHDITERKEAELIIQQQNNQLQELNATKDKFFSIIAHDLRSPFQGFLGMTEMMLENIGEFTAEELAKLIGEINHSAQNLYKLLQNLLDWAQLQRGSFSFTPEEFSLSTIVSENIEQIKKRALQKGITLINKVPEEQKVFVDGRMVNSILGNLLSNAIKFTRKEGEVTIKTKTISNTMLEISIADTGMGMSDSFIKKLFKIDEKVGRKGTEGEPSSGLGLLLCKEFVEKHGGKIWVESEEEKGSTFYFTLPVGRDLYS